MPVIITHTEINAPIDRCFDLSRSIDLHKISTKHTKEEAIGGVTSGLINLDESVTWRAVHLGVSQTLTSKITAFERPFFFVDEMVYGAFKRFHHKHKFEFKDGVTRMTDHFDYESPFGILGKIIDFIILKRYMANLLAKRNQTIKEFAESDKWINIL